MITAAVILLALAGLVAYAWDDLFKTLETASSETSSRSEAAGAVSASEATQDGPLTSAAASLVSLGAVLPCSDGRTVDGRHP